ncbi:fatty acid desaturase [Zavarzinia aquatilis]|uniref:Fatty acid desaturase n=2 Tax=Zavarzinia aquatilis TaxID=2211142 RepID=A0A317EEI2_9PROT|nr:fatty acid desaturase [Zavarzinia aquatilis]
MGDFAWLTVLLAVGVAAAHIATVWLFISGAMPPWLAFFAIAALTYASYTPLHEAAHSNIQGRHAGFRWVGEICGYLCAPMIMLPHSSHRLEHLDHHRHTNDPDKDPDFHISTMGSGIGTFLLAPWKLLFIHSTYIFRHHWHTRATFAAKCVYVAELVFGLGWRVAVLTQVPLATGLPVIVGGYAVGAYFTIYWFAYRPHWPYDKVGRYVDTCSMIVPGWAAPLYWILLGQSLHSIHHAFPRVPFYRYYGVFREAEAAMRAHGAHVVDIFSSAPVPAAASASAHSSKAAAP